MWLVDREKNGIDTGRIALPSPLRAALVRWYIGTGDRGDEEAGIMLVQQARIGAKWIACDCLGDRNSPPILTPAYLSEAETFYLRRLTGSKRPDHRLDCPFFRDQATNRLSEVRRASERSDPADGFFEVLRPAPEKLAQRPGSDATDDRTRQGSLPRLARLLWRLLDLAGTHRLEFAPGSIKEQFSMLERVAGAIEVAPSMELTSVLWTHGQALHSRRAYAVLRELADRWPQGHAPQGFLIVFADRIQGHEVFAAGCEPIRVANRVQSPSRRGEPVKGPYLVIIVVGEYPEKRGFAPLRAYAQPVLSGHRFVPVDSELERSVLREFLKVQLALSRRGIDLAVERPIFDRLTPLGPGRPDLWVEACSQTTGEVHSWGVDYSGLKGAGGVSESRRALIQQFGSVLDLSDRHLTGGALERFFIGVCG